MWIELQNYIISQLNFNALIDDTKKITKYCKQKIKLGFLILGINVKSGFSIFEDQGLVEQIHL